MLLLYSFISYYLAAIVLPAPTSPAGTTNLVHLSFTISGELLIQYDILFSGVVKLGPIENNVLEHRFWSNKP